ncbi:MAG: hypothetical protein AAF672_06925 [Pseudomonadota bacterium]
MSETKERVGPFKLLVCFGAGVTNLWLGNHLVSGEFFANILGYAFLSAGALAIAMAAFVAIRQRSAFDAKSND